MRRVGLYTVLFIILLQQAAAQQTNNWVFGWRAGINFNQSPAQPFLSEIHDIGNDSTPSTFPQAVSDCNGKLLYYIGGDTLVWNKQNNLLNTMGEMKFGNFNNLFIPAPCSDSQVYLFIVRSDIDSPGLDYFLLNNNMDSGRGDFEKYRIHITDSFGKGMGFIKHKNDTDYWLLFKTSIYTMHAYLLTKKGINDTPVISSCYGTWAENYLRVSNNGKMIISPRYISPNPTSFNHFLYDFDRSTGKLSNQRGLIPKTFNYVLNLSFSPNDSIIYYSGNKRSGSIDTSFIYQMPTYSSNPFNNSILAGYIAAQINRIYGARSLQLGPDNRIYYQASLDSTYKSLSYIKYPDLWGKGCELAVDGFKLLQGSNSLTQKFPCHSFPVKRIKNHFDVTGADGCGYDSVRLTADADSAFKNYHWYFGDGDSAVGKSVVHQYKNPGSYYVTLACELGNCGYKQWVGDSVIIKFKPNIGLGIKNDIHCGYQIITANIKYKYSDTLQFAWGDGKDTLIYVKDTSLVDSIYNLQHIYTTSGAYAISCRAWNSNCYDSVANIYNITIDTFPKVSFGADFTTGCGTKTIILTDTSKFDSIITNRTWQISKVGGLDTTITTGSVNNVSFLFNDTGIYSVKLTIQSRQGCTDSLEKAGYIQINPNPVVNINGKTKWCGIDSTTLTANGGNSYKWSTGDTTASVFLKPVTSNYYSVLVTNVYNCSVKDSVYITVGEIVSPSFTPDYITSCGYSTITLTDSSGGKDSILQQRKWAIEFPNNLTKQFDTVTSNKLKLNIQDTGYFHAKLIYITKQGCMDSLYKPKVFRILPQPDVYIDSNMKNPLCFGDSFILTAKQKNTGYPPLTSYKWNMGQVSTLSIKVDSSNTYYVAAYNNYGCGSTSNKVKIDFLPQLFASVKKAKDSLYVITNRPVVAWEWYKDTILYNTTSSLFHPPTGRYTVTVTDANGCQASSASLLHTGIPALEPADMLSVVEAYPNPASDVLYLEGLPPQKIEIVLYDMLGRSVNHTSTNGETLYNISVRNFPKGIYILCVGTERVKVIVE